MRKFFIDVWLLAIVFGGVAFCLAFIGAFAVTPFAFVINHPHHDVGYWFMVAFAFLTLFGIPIFFAEEIEVELAARKERKQRARMESSGE